MGAVTEFIPGRIWLIEYPIRYWGIQCNARTTLVDSGQGDWIAHSPGPLTAETTALLDSLGPVRAILAPGTFHHLHVRDWIARYPRAGVFICPGLERKRPDLGHFPAIEDQVVYPFSTTLDHLVVRSNRFIREAAFLHRDTRTLILTDLVEHFTDETPCNWQTRFWLKLVFRTWNSPRPAPEYRLGWWGRRRRAREELTRLMAWDFEHIIPGHGEPIRGDGRAVARQAFGPLLA